MVVEKIEQRLASWKRLYLLQGGRITLIKSTLPNLPMYFLSMFPIPVSVVIHIEKLHHDFLWNGTENEYKFHLIKWDNVCSLISFGGWELENWKLSIEFYLKNGCGDIIWNREPCRSRWLIANIELYGGWCTREANGASGMGVWKHIRCGWRVFAHHNRLVLGDGTRIKF